LTIPTPKLRAAGTAVAAALIAFYFWFFAQRDQRSGFSHDDLLNLHFAWQEPLADILRANLFIRTNVLRPAGTLFYRVFYESFGLDPGPYRLLCDIALWVNLLLVYRCAFVVTASREVGLLTVLLYCVQGNFFPLYYASGNCYDIFASVFYFGAFALAVRPGGRFATWPHCVAAAALYGLAVNAKESAASLPAVLLAYQLLHSRPKAFSWIWRDGRAVLTTGLIAALFLWARFSGSNNLLSHPAYAPSFTVLRYLQSTVEYLNETTAPEIMWKPQTAAVLLAGMVLVAVILRSRSLVMAWLLVILGAAPIAFVIPRGVAAYCIPLVGYAMFHALLLVKARRLVSPSSVAQAVLFACLYGLLWKWQIAHRRDLHVVREEMAVISDAIRQIGAHPQWFRSNANILIASDSFDAETPWTSSFISILTARDRSVRVQTIRGMPSKPSPAELERYTTIIAFENGKYTDVTAKARARGL
jgi:hypothetical protein